MMLLFDQISFIFSGAAASTIDVAYDVKQMYKYLVTKIFDFNNLTDMEYILSHLQIYGQYE